MCVIVDEEMRKTVFYDRSGAMGAKKAIFKLLSLLCLIVFYFTILIGIFAILLHLSFIWDADSALSKSFGKFEPIFSYLELHFYQEPNLYMEKSFMVLSLISITTMILTALLFLRLMYKLLKNIYKDSLFMYENVSIIFKLGLTYLILGTAFTYTDGLLLSKALSALDITNAEIQSSNLSYIDSITWGIVLIILASALKTAVHAVEENKKTI